MDDLSSSEELAFVTDDVEAVVMPVIDAILKGADFDYVKVPQWTDSICEGCMKGLVELKKPFKYTGERFGTRQSLLSLLPPCPCFLLLN